MRIENYLGFPTGITGAELAEHAVLQANKFGAHLPVAAPVTGLTFDNVYAVLHLDNGEAVAAKCLLIATGADYRRLGVEGCEPFEGCGVYYAATPIEARLCRGSDVVVVGGGNSAGQATVFLAGQVRKVYLVVRGGDLYEHMSSYLANRIEETPNIEVLLNTEVGRMSGDRHLSEVELVNNKTGEAGRSRPRRCSASSARCRGPTGSPRRSSGTRRASCGRGRPWGWTARANGQPFLLETSRPGVFAAGDVRSGSIKRVASAVGEGAMAVQFVHEYLREIAVGAPRGGRPAVRAPSRGPSAQGADRR